MVVSVKFDAEMGDYEAGITDAIKAIRDWESQTGVSALNVTEKFEDAIRAVVEIGDKTGRSKDEVVRALQGLELSAEDAEAAFEAIGREAKQSLGKAADSVDDLGEAAEDAGEKTATITDKTGAVGDGLRDLGSIARDVLEGDFGSAAGTAIEALGGIAGALTGGLVGGAIASAVAGIVGDWVSQWDSAAKEVELRVSDMTSKLIDGFGQVKEAAILSGVEDYLTNTEKMAEAQKIVAATGTDLTTVLRGLNGDMTDAETVSKDLADARQDLADKQKANLDNNRPYMEGLQEESQELLKAEDQWRKYNGALDEAGGKWAVYADAAAQGLVRIAESEVAAGRATKTIDEFGDTIYNLPDGKQIYIDAETGRATEDTEAIAQKIFSVPDKTATVTVNVQDNATAQMNGIISRLSGRSVTVGVGTVLKPGFLP